MKGRANNPAKTVPIFKLIKDKPVPKYLAIPAVRYIWMASRPVLRGKNMRVCPINTSCTSKSFSA